MRNNIIYLIGFMVLGAFNILMDYMSAEDLNIGENLFQALFIIVFIRLMFWLEKKSKQHSKEEKSEAGNR